MKKLVSKDALDTFRESFGREPTQEDIEKISARLVRQLDSGTATGTYRTEGDRRLSLTAMLEGVREVSPTLTEHDVYSVIDSLAKEEKKQINQEIQENLRKSKRRQTLLKLSAAGIFLGAALGTFLPVQNIRGKLAVSGYEAKVAQLEAEYNARRTELEERFLAPLPDLFQGTSVTLPIKERESLLEEYLNISGLFGSNYRTFYESAKDGTKLEVMASPNLDRLVLIKRATDGGVFSAYVYDVTKCSPLGGCSGSGLDNLLKNNIPLISILFEGTESKVIYHYTVRRAGSGNAKQEIHGEAASIYTKHSKNILRQFRNLYSRTTPFPQNPDQKK